ncbi:MAG: hypothetical protein JSS32_05720 [Verrucomicrobia bacterium]|nr:hypothetical protein [Verrucomicrobiota bacterium]
MTSVLSCIREVYYCCCCAHPSDKYVYPVTNAQDVLKEQGEDSQDPPKVDTKALLDQSNRV